MKWDRNDWQGRSEENVRFSNTVVAISIIAAIAVTFISSIILLL